MTAWFVGKVHGQDLRNLHSGNLGARNAGRTFGRGAFVMTATGDVLKGIGVVLMGRAFGLSETVVALGVLAVVCGHLYPFWLAGRGGKGVATILGALLVFSWQASVVCAISFLFMFGIKRSATLGLMMALAAYSIAVIYWQVEGFIYLTFAISLVMWKHRGNISERVK